MLTDADHVWHAMYFKHPNERARYIKSQIPHADTDHLLRKYNKFPKIYRDDLVEFAVIVNGKVIDTVQKREEAHDLAKNQDGYVVVADVPKSESRNPQYDRYYQEIIKTPLVPLEEEVIDLEEEQEEQEEKEVVVEDKTIKTSSTEPDIVHEPVEEEQTCTEVVVEQTLTELIHVSDEKDIVETKKTSTDFKAEEKEEESQPVGTQQTCDDPDIVKIEETVDV